MSKSLEQIVSKSIARKLIKFGYRLDKPQLIVPARRVGAKLRAVLDLVSYAAFIFTGYEARIRGEQEPVLSLRFDKEVADVTFDDLWPLVSDKLEFGPF